METLKWLHVKYIDNGFWQEIDKSILLNAIKRSYKEESVEWIVPTDIIINWGKVLVKWNDEFIL